MLLSGKRVFVTGGSRGIGKGICRIMAENGADVIAPTRSELDLSSRDSIKQYLEAKADLNPDIFIHCAGTNILSGIEEISNGILDNVFQVNYFAPVQLLNCFVKSMKTKKQGKIVFISSLYALISRERRIAYSSSKNALTGLMKSLALEVADSNILVNAIAPGYVLTDMTKRNLSEAEIKDLTEAIPTKRMQTVEDIANLCLFLCSNQNNSITGQLIAVDGGFSIK